jgi:uncharacterized protein YqeY
MDQFVLAQNIKRYRNLLETSVNETERQTIQNLLDEEEATQALQGMKRRRKGDLRQYNQGRRSRAEESKNEDVIPTNAHVRRGVIGGRGERFKPHWE